MASLPGGKTIEIARGRLDGELGERILAFWSARGALEGEAARQRLQEVVCVLLDEGGEILGVNSVHEESIPLIGGRRFYVYRVFMLPDGAAAANDMFNAAFEALDAEFGADRSGAIGICVAVAAGQVAAQPEAIWPETHLLYAGTQPDGSQLRIRYFYDATIGPGLPNSPTIAQSEAVDYSLPPGYRMVPLAETDSVGPDDVLELWERERAMLGSGEGERRVREVSIVALDPSDRLAAVSTVYLAHNAQLDMDMWYLRGFVATEHRMSNLATRILWATRDHLREAYESGRDTRAPGILLEIENELLMTYFNRAFWVYSDFWFIGAAENGVHVRVHYFPGAQVPVPS